MRTKNTLVRLQRFRCEEKRRQVAEIEAMIGDFQRKQEELDQQVQLEEARTGLSDPHHFSYSLTAKALRRRRDNLIRSIADLKEQLVEARSALKEAEGELQRSELLADKGPGSILPASQQPGLQVAPLRS
jgi:flagellar export protein FliJ